MAKVLVLNGSPKASGCTATALNEIIVTLEKEGIETELIQVGKRISGAVLHATAAENPANAFLMILSTKLLRSLKARTGWSSAARFITDPPTERFSLFWTGFSTALTFPSR